MPNTQLIIFTPVPASLQLNPASIKVSVLVSPRLRGDDTLAAYPDWLNWTETRKESGLRVTFECNATSLTVDLNTDGLRTDLWKALFNAETFVRSHQFDDYHGKFVSSYGVRNALGLLKATYQSVGIEFALPAHDEDPLELTGRLRGRRRGRFNALVRPYALEWTDEKGRQLLAEQRIAQGRLSDQLSDLGRSRSSLTGALDESGLIATGALDPDTAEFRNAQSSLAKEFGVFNHVPQGAPVTRQSLDDKRVLDFHQALSSLGTYPDLMRKLGLVFDLDLPLDFVAPTTSSKPDLLSITAVEGNWDSATETTVPRTSTAYIHSAVEGQDLFAVAPRSTSGKAQTQRPLVMGLLNLDRSWFGLAQVDVDGAMHKTVMHADNLSQLRGESVAQHPEVFDPATTLASLRSGGLSLFADSRALSMLDTFQRSKEMNHDLENNQPQQDPFFAEDLTRGYRLDVWDSLTGQWHSLHRRDTSMMVGEVGTNGDGGIELTARDEEGFFQAAATQAAPDENGNRASADIYLHEAMVRWSGWSLSAGTVGVHLTRAGDPDKAVPNPDEPDPENEAVTPFKVRSSARHVKGSLPRLRFGVGYRVRVRQVDLAGNGLRLDDPETALRTPGFSMPRGNGVIPYLRFEPVVAPAIVMRDKRALDEGSSSDRLVIRTFNASPSLDESAAQLTASERHIAPPNIHVDMAERHGMFDDASGKLIGTPAMWELIKARDESTFHQEEFDRIVIDGRKQSYPLETGAQIDPLPYLPDPLARSAAFRNLPGTPAASIGRAAPGAGPEQPVGYETLSDAQPRPGSATIIEFGGRTDWQDVKPFRLALADGDGLPRWDPQASVLTVALPKGTTHVIPVSSCCDPEDLKYLGIWQWLREYIEHVTSSKRLEGEFFQGTHVKDRIAHILQLAMEGGHGMLTPPHLLTLVHAVQQPIGFPAFGRLTGQLNPQGTKLQTAPETQPTAATELDVLTSWRELGGTDAWLVGLLQVHGPSTAKVDIRATWTDPVDSLTPDAAGAVPDPGHQDFAAQVDEVPLPVLRRGYLKSNGENRHVGFYDPDHDVICLAPGGTSLGNSPDGEILSSDSMPRHQIGDTRHHVVTYTPVAASRYQEYFPKQDAAGDDLEFTRTGLPVTVHVPASTRPVAPHVRYVVPTFGWERAASGNQVRSVRTGGGLRIYLDRPWHSSGAGELLGVSLTYDDGRAIDREEWKPFITQWGQDPIWLSKPMAGFPGIDNFPDATASERNLPLEERISAKLAMPRLVDVAGHEVSFDPVRKLYYCDLTVDTKTATYSPFIRLALVRYQPHALVEAKVSRVVLADFAQLTPERALMVTADPYSPGVIRVAVSGPAPRGPVPRASEGVTAGRPTVIEVSAQVKNPDLNSDLAWSTDASFSVSPEPSQEDLPPGPDFILWSGSVRQVDAEPLGSGRYRLLIQEYELYDADDERAEGVQLGKRLIYAETIPLDESLLQPPPVAAATTTMR